MALLNNNDTLTSLNDPEVFRSLRGVLDAAGFTDGEILERLGAKDIASVLGNDISLLLHRTRKGTPLDTLIRLFLMEVPTEVEAVRNAIQPMKIETWVKLRLIQIDGNSAIANIKLLPYRNLILAFDPLKSLQTEMGYAYVMGIGSSSLTLSNLTIRRHSRSTLDLGTGCGFQALLASQHSGHVIAVDRNPRAVQFAAFNAKLNGVSNIEFLEGDLFEPVRGRKFDLVISNPPYVISPEMRYIYRDSGMEGDQICQKIVRQVPEFLEEDGYCQILCNWAEYSGQDWRERIAGWFEGTGCDAWVIRTEKRDADLYASLWIQHTERGGFPERTKYFQEWMDYYQQHHIDAIGAGAITMRRSSTHANWFRADDDLEKMLGPCGDHIVRGFELRDFLGTVRDDAALLDTCLRISPHVHLELKFEPSSEKWAEISAQMRLTRGLPYVGNIDPYVANLLIGCNGQQKLGDLLVKMATSLELDPGNIATALCDVVRRLIERGFLLPPTLPELNEI